MRAESLNSLITAKNLLDMARSMSLSSDRHLCSAGLVVLQDSLELILLACLLELNVDNDKAIEKLTFDQLVGELKAQRITVPRSGTIKAMNKERVIVKHFGQLSEPETAKNHLSACEYCIGEIMTQVFNRTMEDIWLHEFIVGDEVKQCFSEAIRFYESGDYFKALVEIRKAVFIEVEQDYSVFDWRDTTQVSLSNLGVFERAFRGGQKAPYWAKNKEWVDANVREPFDYIQVDHQQLRSDLLEWGVNTQDFWNLWRLTPTVFREKNGSPWLIRQEPKFYVAGSNEENIRYCLDKAISLVVKKQGHFDLAKSLEGVPTDDFEVTTLSDPTRVYQKATARSPISDELRPGLTLRVSSVVRALDGEERFVNVFQAFPENNSFVAGYVRLDDCKPVS